MKVPFSAKTILGRSRWLTKWLDELIGTDAATALTAAIVIIVVIYRAPYRKLDIYKFFKGEDAKPYPYDENGRRVYRWNGTPIEQPKEEQEAQQEPQEADVGGDAPEGEQESKDE